MVYYLILFGLIILTGRYVAPNFAFLMQAGTIVQNLQNIPFEQLGVMADQVKSNFLSFIFLAVLLLLIWLASYSFFKGMIWAKLFEKKFTYKHFLKLCMMNVIVTAVFLLLLSLTAKLIKDENQAIFSLLVIIPLGIHLFHTSNAVMLLESGLKQYFRKFMRVSFRKIVYFIIPFLIMAVMLLLVVIVVTYFQFLPQKVYFVVYLLFFIAYSCWAKQYIGHIVKKMF